DGGPGRRLPEPDRRREPGGPGADDRDVDFDGIGIRRRGERLLDPPRRRVVGRPHFRARTSSVSLGTISFRSPTTARSAYSKIGACGSLLIATITPEPCMPTLCWIAPEIPTATYSFGDTVLPVCPTWVEYGYQPASTTARVAATAPPSADASSSTSAKFSGPPSPRPPATMTSASSIAGPSSASSRVASTSSASSECGSS